MFVCTYNLGLSETAVCGTAHETVVRLDFAEDYDLGFVKHGVRERDFFGFLVHEVLVAKIGRLVDQRGRVFVGLLDLELSRFKVLLTAFLLSR